ncbi:MAG TPA: NAD(P)-dependent oxidoreductase [Solirubrobacteraceae bacterium]|jgi:nucleoside-diphosphate-sugar epimerase|nr:NAD(P)-dependent oxidoreductase [Solirubrobacteraceae bacterium]
MKRVLLTGATGFIGRQAIRPLRDRGYEVHTVSSRAVSSPAVGVPGGGGDGGLEGLVPHQADLLDPAAIAELVDRVRPTHLLHLAWYAEPGKFWTSPENDRWVAASRVLLCAFAQAGGRRAVVAGTCAEYDWSAGAVCREGVTPVEPATLYGRAKATLHAETAAYYSEDGMPTLGWGRIFFLYGPAEHPARLVSSVIRALLDGRPAPCSHGRQVRDFLHTADVAAGFAALLDTEDVSGAVNIASGEPVTIARLVGLVGEACGRPELIELGALPAREDDPPLLVADVRRLRDEVGFLPALALADGIAATVDWWRRELAGG